MKLAHQPRYVSPPGLAEIKRAVRNLQQPAIIVPLVPSRASDSKSQERIQELEEAERLNSERIANLERALKKVQTQSNTKIEEMEQNLASIVKLAHAKDRIDGFTTPKHDIVVGENMVYVADGLNLSSYARVRRPIFQAVKRWAMGK